MAIRVVWGVAYIRLEHPVQWWISSGSRNLYMRKHVNFARVSKIEAMHERLHVKVEVEGGSTLRSTRDLTHIRLI